ncbi:MAG TPA: PDZ domain-containing protein [Pyrinomonadaceae bacterium]|nr:PDZ domain-containing protein [Pyrinomonadaceae bacterium]
MATVVVLVSWCAAAIAQTPSPNPRRPTSQARAGERVNERRLAPQVVTIVHRLNTLKMFRLLLRSERQMQAIAGIESAFNLKDDVHTNVIAGLAMDDGETIAAWLPEAEVEFGPPAMPDPFGEFKPPVLPQPAIPVPDIKQPRLDSPDVTVIGPDGKQLLAKYVGFDASTGLSILKLTSKNLTPPAAMKDERVDVGENVLLFGPEPASKNQSLLSNNVLVRMGAVEGRIQNVLVAPSGDIARLKVSAARLSQANIGGVAVNEAGETIGIVDSLEGNEATILPAASIRRAVQRVLERQASVPRPWLGVRGEPVADLKPKQMENLGWEMWRATALADNHTGIFLTSITPDSPAARASLRAGDVILKVDNKAIQNADDFTWWLEQAGPGNSVQFTVARPDRPVEEPLNVKLSGLLDSAFGLNSRFRFVTNKGTSLLEHGIETVALRPVVAAQLGTTSGLLVVYVEAGTPAFDAGLQPGDVIHSIDGRPITTFSRMTQFTATQSNKPLTLEVFRNKQKRTIKLPAVAKKK